MPSQDLGDSASVFFSGPSSYATFGCSAIIEHGINTWMSPEAVIKLPIFQCVHVKLTASFEISSLILQQVQQRYRIILVCVRTSKPDPTSTRKLSSIWFKEHSRGFELFVYWIFPEIGSKKLQPQENYPKDKMLKIICWDICACAQGDHLDSNPI